MHLSSLGSNENGADGEFARVSKMFFGWVQIVEAHVRGEGALPVQYLRGSTLISASGNTISHFSELWFKDNWDAAMLGGRRDRRPRVVHRGG